ncbi:hypothetical protein ACH4GE_20645 [Streptomyces tendae]|uniref:hypothetical protein n=1 Tax=Streptomyces tendae TaxID=1932 RepID=UPI0037932A9F
MNQTITNIIAGLLHADRCVLFDSEKAAALDVVLQRLTSPLNDVHELFMTARHAANN